MKQKILLLCVSAVLCAAVPGGCQKEQEIIEDKVEETISETETAEEDTDKVEETISATEAAEEDTETVEADIGLQKETEAAESSTTEESQAEPYSYEEIAEMMYVVSDVNVRNLPSVEGEKIGNLVTAQEVNVTGRCNETSWYRVDYKGEIGYVSDRYLTEEKPVPIDIAVSQTSEQTSASEQEISVTTETTVPEQETEISQEPTTQQEPVEPQPSGLVCIDNLANKKSLQKSCTAEEFQAAYDVAAQIVTPLIGLSQEEQLSSIAAALRSMVDNGQVVYSTEAQHYNDPYGYFVAGVASCAGCARATGLCLNMLGISYEHVNENQWSHQWCRVNINGTYWICDAYGLYVGPEPAPYAHPYL